MLNRIKVQSSLALYRRCQKSSEVFYRSPFSPSCHRTNGGSFLALQTTWGALRSPMVDTLKWQVISYLFFMRRYNTSFDMLVYSNGVNMAVE